MSRGLVVVFIPARCALLLLSQGGLAQEAPVASDPVVAATANEAALAPAAVPSTLVAEEMASYDIVSPKIFWQRVIRGNCDGDVNDKSWQDAIRRIAIQNSITRTLYLKDEVGSQCGGSISSNIVSDGNYVYFVRGTFQRLPVLANPGDATESIPTDLTGRAELVRATGAIYVLTESRGLWRVNTETFTLTQLRTAAQVGTAPRHLQTDGEFLFWLTNGRLRQMQLSNNAIADFAPTGVTNYTLQGDLCFIQPCSPDSRVYMGVGNRIDRYKAIGRTFEATIFTGAVNDRFDEMVVSGNNLFFAQEEETTCEPICTYTTLLKRKTLGSVTAPVLLYQWPSIFSGSHVVNQLITFNGYLYWIDHDPTNTITLKRMPEDAATLPLTNLRITNIEITQGLQRLDNSVRLINGKRTFVRVHVRSDGTPVDGVTLFLSRLNAPGGAPIGEPLRPVNPSGQYLTVKAAPDRAVLDDAFLFELPASWLGSDHGQAAQLTLRAELNPYKFPAQASYANNVRELTKSFAPSGRLDVRFVLFQYNVDGTEFAPDLIVDFYQTVSWINRAYPLSSAGGYYGLVSNVRGFNMNFHYVTDNALKDYITQAECGNDDSLCASDYVHGLLEDWDEEWSFPSAPMYGMMPYYLTNMPNPNDGFFPRGSQWGDTITGPAAVPVRGNWSWDVDGTIADWYAGHEIAHFLGRDHPTPNGDPEPDEDPKKRCGHSQSDDDFPYADARIGVGDLFGFDMGNPATVAISVPTVYAPNAAFDLMSYCHPVQWISDYTYNGLYDAIMGLDAVRAADAAEPRSQGAYFYLYGFIDADKASANFVRVRHKNGDFTPSTPGSGDYAVRFVNAGGAFLSAVDIQTEIDEERPTRQRFILNLPSVAGVAAVQILHKPSGTVYGQYAISPNAPQVSNVSIGAVANPVSGQVTLTWNATDPDGDALTFDVHYSRDNGVTFQPLKSSLSGNSVVIDTQELGGSGQASLRVTASDGSNTTQASTPTFVMANKPPLVLITSPGNGAHFQYGQMIHFSGDAYDLQGEAIATSEMKWSRGNVALGTGPTLAVSDLPVGQQVINFTVKNGAGLAASRSITIVVGDDLNITGPTLTVAPVQLGWHFALDATTPQTATLTIANPGSGSYNWSAQANAPWLSLKPISGTAPAQIVVTVDPKLIPEQEGISSSIIVTGTNGQQLVGVATVPVHAAFGNGYVAAFPGPEFEPINVYLPVIKR